MRAYLPRPATPRRGLTLIEMLVVVALVVLMMTALVQIFGAATNAISVSRDIQELDGRLRLLDATIRRDLDGVTARMTPPLNPRDNLGYFEYIENALSDAQLEDTDDCIAFTAKAPDGQPFTGRMWVADPPGVVDPARALYQRVKPVTITSQYAEIIYFLRNGNLYRRVLLIAPEKQSAVQFTTAGLGFTPINMFAGSLTISWLGVNDLSARPSMRIDPAPRLNTLGDLTNRENRFARPRFAGDFFPRPGGSPGPDGVADDLNQDGVPDYYPTLFPAAFSQGVPIPLVNEDLLNRPYPAPGRMPLTHEVFAFPYVYPGAYSVPAGLSTPSFPDANFGWVHGMHLPTPPYGENPQLTNHAPLADSSADDIATPILQTWWGFPTWRETMSLNWYDPVYSINQTTSSIANISGIQAPGLRSRFTAPNVWMANNGLPALDPANRAAINRFPELSAGPPPVASDNAGSNTFLMPPAALRSRAVNPLHPNMVWEDDLIMTNVRSFDIKAFDPSVGSYEDLGWGSGPKTNYDFQQFYDRTVATYLLNNEIWNTVEQTFMHEGRMPPLITDLRVDPQAPQYNIGVGTDAAPLPTVVRLRRVWDTWSTTYTRAPASDISQTHGYPFGGTRPVYPSFPPPYPMPLRGIQITIKLNDEDGERAKTLTIRHDFSDRL